MSVRKSSQSLAQRRHSYASLMMHVLHWALMENVYEHSTFQPANSREAYFAGVKKGELPCNDWYSYVRMSSQLLGSPQAPQMNVLRKCGAEAVVERVKDILRNENAASLKVYRKTPRAARVVSASKFLNYDRVLAARCVMRYIWMATSTGGISLERSKFSILLDSSMAMLGDLNEQQEKTSKVYIDSPGRLSEIIKRNNLPLPMKMPEFLAKDKYFQKLRHSVRFMNGLDGTCDRG